MGKKQNFNGGHPIFIKYTKMIANHSAYSGMPDILNNKGGIQWAAPSNRSSGKFKETHIKRKGWWEAKAAKVGISTDESAWISKVAKLIHPTKKKPCRVCGKIMSIQYIYLNSFIIKRLIKEGFTEGKVEQSDLTPFPLFLKSSTEALSSSSCLRQCGHHVAQKKIIDLSPSRNSLKFSFFPETVANVKSGAFSPSNGLSIIMNWPRTLDGVKIKYEQRKIMIKYILRFIKIILLLLLRSIARR